MSDVGDAARIISDLGKALSSDAAVRYANAVAKSHDRDSFHLAILGEFKRGKTSLVNSLLGTDLLPTDVLPSTATITVVEYSDNPSCTITWADGRREEWPADVEAMSRLSVSGDVPAEDVRHVVVRMPVDLLSDDLVLIDTPGVNDISESRIEVTKGILPHCDGALFLLDAAAPVTRSEADFLETQVLSQKMDSIVFVIAKADRLSSDELTESIEGARSRLIGIIGREPHLVAYSSVAAAEAFGSIGGPGNHMADLLSMVNVIRKEASDCHKVRDVARLQLALEFLRDEVSLLTAFAEAEEEQIRQFQALVEAEEMSLDATLSILMASIDVVGRETLLKMIDKSLSIHMKDVQIKLEEEIRAISGDASEFCRSRVPIIIRRAMKEFADKKAVEIHAFTNRFSVHVAQEYRKAFDIPVQNQLVRVGIERTEFVTTLETVERPKLPPALEQFGPMIGGAIAASFLLPGIGALGSMIGMMGGRILGEKYSKKKAAEQRESFLAGFPTLLGNIAKEYLRHVRTAVDRGFDTMKADLANFHEQQCDSLKKRIKLVLPSPMSAQDAVSRADVEAFEGKIEAVEEALKAIKTSKGES